ncbi:hypothetical protein PSH90_25880 [Pseudomonas sp. FP1762]|jgi:hypothetical protein|uniref:Uncharacterized protein n=1 Tax=Pseudomonas helmanticensis TaxID=1471381 RepID=A0A4V3FSH6_9PSED|nr:MULTISPECIES: hypothetical protein [Pseudomonas]TDV47481.1 hypothetical protein EDF87_10651 [Pseudomonas helmanticensis]WLG62246.1 hypothetical protein PSH90_25880 [Pseudomonas sp. FP1762]
MSKIEVSIKADFTFKPTLGNVILIVSKLALLVSGTYLAVSSYLNNLV